MVSYQQHFASFKQTYGDFIALAQLAAALVVVSAVLFPSVRAKLAWRVLGVFWLLTALNYYLKTVGGTYGAGLAAVCVGEALLLLFNWERLRVFGEISFSAHLVLPMTVDLRTVNGTVGCLGSFSLLVRVYLGLTCTDEPARLALLPLASPSFSLHCANTEYGRA